MFDLALEAAEPVDMLVSTKVLCEFILCSTWPYDDKPLHLLDLTLSDTFDLYHLATRFEVPLAIESGCYQIGDAARQPRPFWQALIRASNENDHRLGKVVIKKIDERKFMDVDFILFLSELQEVWQHSLLRSVFGIATHRKHQLDLEKYRGLPGDFTFEKPDGKWHYAIWHVDWDPSGKSDAEL
jgi:hypothetical protein